ncbi:MULTISPECIES: two-component system response regulator ArcA [unclassified Colwellia]|uniref:two-component system response regulator ArcA n=1 Tax=unclassified Colwellia TaxID=196834 RepID=UPI0015F36295|nr:MULTISPECIES: two-component system response regulator ArcA [unclassified Colwellia]MBA6232170.1 two-component system response regulator ArcA [Colwellia sp. MB02u-7]MBA6237132.1 two-component system response regulator ArcA [Colwellia sp. MB02u-11]MBA6257436.1 two-component system response regulator ArcA [Colwellia sp. MB3u-28]MBA6260508.1 two-component system response regulator ArcA [Colwellia sp. MB3u-41]MBA6301604.1 two-component system response regulator ArcA [Colwellia sp. MB3u-22]
MQKPHILIVEDEDVTRFNLRNLFEAEGYQVSEATDGESMDTQLQKNTINLVIMDINLPGKNGLLLARELTSNNELGLIFLTGRDSDIDKILGLEIGADDYLTKPFNPRELTIRARNILNRIGQTKNEVEKAVITFNEWSLDGNSRKMTAPDGQVLAIPRGEYRALRLLIENTGQIVTRQQLIKEMTGRDLRSNDRTVDVTIRRLRKHFESVPDAPELINTIHGEGYRFIGSVD